MMQTKEEQCEDELIDSLLQEHSRRDREKSIWEIENAIMKDMVSHAAHPPLLNWKHMFISGSIAAALVLGFGYFLSLILLPEIHGKATVKVDPDEAFPPKGYKSMYIKYIVGRNPNAPSNNPPKVLPNDLSPQVPASAPNMAMNPLTESGEPIEVNPNTGIEVPAVDLLTNPEEPLNKVRYARLLDQEWCSPYDKPLSAFGVDVERSSYGNIRQLVSQGAPIPVDVVRIEECVNSFKYDYKGPTDNKAFAVHTDLISCPWNGANVLVRIGIKGREIPSKSDPVAIAKEVQALVEFNPQLVGAYRLIGYASPMLQSATADKDKDKADAGDFQSGHEVTAFYEIVPARQQRNLVKVDPLKYQRVGSSPNVVGPKDEWLTLKLHFKQPQGDVGSLQEKVLKGAPIPWQQANSETRFATSVVLFGMKLRHMDEVEGITWQQVVQVADLGFVDDRYKDRAEFIELINTLEADNR